MKRDDTLDFLVLWEEVINPEFLRIGFDTIKERIDRNSNTVFFLEAWEKMHNPDS